MDFTAGFRDTIMHEIFEIGKCMNVRLNEKLYRKELIVNRMIGSLSIRKPVLNGMDCVIGASMMDAFTTDIPKRKY